MKGRLIRQWIGFVIILIGFCVLAAPFVMGYFRVKEQDRALELVNQVLDIDLDVVSVDSDGDEYTSNHDDAKIADESSDDSAKTADEKDKPDLQSGEGVSREVLAALYEVCLNYNEAIYNRKQEKMTDKTSVERFDFDTTEYGFPEDTIGRIWVPRLEVEYPLYLGSSMEHMATGVALFGETSIPMRETKNAISCIAGHRGMLGTPMFRDIQTVQIGDPIYVKTPWDEMVYRVCDLQIVSPDDNRWCQIQTGRNMIALMTCHPYTKNYQRYVIFAELTDEIMPERDVVEQEMADTYDESPRVVTDISDGTEKTVYVDSTTIEPNGTEYGAVWSNAAILAEKQMKIIVYVVGILVVVLFIWLCIKTGKESKKS